jgi:hypothetical protein
MQTTILMEKELHFIDIKLISEKTPTANLESRLSSIVEKYKK